MVPVVFSLKAGWLLSASSPVFTRAGGQAKDMAEDDYGAFIQKFILHPPAKPQPPNPPLPLSSLTFAVKDIFDINGYVTGFGNLDWARTHMPALSSSPSVLAVIEGGATCVGKTIMDEMAYSINGENKHYGTPTNPSAPERIPGGSSSGSAVAVAAKLVDFALGSDTGGSVRAPAAFCGILGFRPSHGVVSTAGVIPMAQSFDTVGWFARDPIILSQVGQVLLKLPDVDHIQPSHAIIADDCFQLLSIPTVQLTGVFVKSIEKLYGCEVISHVNLGDYVSDKVASLKWFMNREIKDNDYPISSLSALSNALRLLQRYEFKNNHGEWVSSVNPDLGPGISERVWEALGTTDENIEHCHTTRTELRAALTALLEDNGILVIPTVPGPPPKLRTQGAMLDKFRARAFSLLSIAGMSGFCQVTVPLGVHENCPLAISFLARHGADRFLLNFVQVVYSTLKEQAEIAAKC